MFIIKNTCLGKTCHNLLLFKISFGGKNIQKTNVWFGRNIKFTVNLMCYIKSVLNIYNNPIMPS